MSVVDESLSEVRAQVKADVENLTRTVAEIDNDFSRIQEFVSGLDRTDLLTEKFEPRWRGLHDKYTELCASSRVRTNQIKEKIATLTEALNPILNNEKYELQSKKDELKGYVDSLKAFQADATNAELSFIGLSEEARDLQNDPPQAAENEGNSNRGQTQYYEAEVQRWQGDLDNSDVWRRIFHSEEIEDIENRLRDNRYRLELCRNKEGEINSVRGGLNALNESYNSLITNLTIMEAIWRLLTTDAQSLEYHLEDMTMDRTSLLASKGLATSTSELKSF